MQLTFFLCFLSFSSLLLGQGWERTYGGTGLELGYGVLQTANGDFISCGYNTSFGNNGEEAIYLVRTDIDGTTIWERTHAFENSRTYGQAIIETTDGNYMVAGYILHNSEDENIFLLKVTPDGDIIWSSTIEGPGRDFGFRVIETADNGFAIVGETRDLLSDQRDIYFVKTDSNGDEEWSKRIGDVLFDIAFSVVQNSSGEYILAAYETTIEPSDTTREAVLIKTDQFGEVLDRYSLGETVVASGADVLITNDGGYVAAVYNESGVFLKKLDANGAQDWEKLMPDLTILPGAPLILNPNNGYTIVGNFQDTGQNESDLRIIKTDENGDVLWDKTLGSPINDDVGLGVCNAQGNGYGIIGYTRSFGAGFFDFYLLHTDSLGNTLNNFISGNVFYDLNENCDADAGEFGLNDWLLEVIADDNSITYYGLTDEDGNYEIAVKSGSYTFNLVPINAYWSTTCGNSFNLSLSGPYDTVMVDFPLHAVYDCPLMEVDISTPFLRRCFDNRYKVEYCNDGTVLGEDVEVEVELDEYLIFNDASVNWTNVGNVYTFEIGDVEVNECGNFYIDVTVDCDSTLLGQTHCVEAHITPDSSCIPPLQCWDGGSIELRAACEEDSIRFSIKNVGTAPISQLSEYIIIEDHIILRVEPFGETIEPDSTIFILEPADGHTLRMIAEQPTCHPGDSIPTAAVEGCGQVDDSEISLGYLTQYYENDGNPWISIDCQENIGSWDPNDKRGFPKGYEEAHYIEANQDLEYIIRFQNTGTDTAFRVVIRDTISEWLDIRDIQVGASSHEYDFEVYGSNILKFTFDNINLPDSTTNEVASHGFVKFRIAQQIDNPLGTVIHNKAAIYFDYNEPIITNETMHTIGDEFIKVSYQDVFVPGVSIKLYPNPFTELTTFEISYENGMSPDFETKTFHLFDLYGRLVRSEQFDGNKFQFQRNGLATGLYFFEIENNKELIIGGKLIAH